MKLIVTVDTEEDNWDRYSTIDNPVRNIERIAILQKIFDEFGVLPTYLVTYPVATNPKTVSVLKKILEDGKCEIGMHCHPWNTPPFEEEINIFNSMLCNLPEHLQYRKLEFLKNAISKNFDISPVTFRAGRWAFGNGTAKIIHKLGFKIDSSVTAYTDWSKWHGVDYQNVGPSPYYFSLNNIFKKVKEGELLQVPASVGFLQRNFDICNTATRLLNRPFFKRCRIPGILQRLKILNKVALSPEASTSQNMIALAKRMQTLGFEYINMFFHSTSLMGGLSPYVTSKEGEVNFLKRIERFLSFSTRAGITSLTMSQVEGI
jgi:hypothetical protein